MRTFLMLSRSGFLVAASAGFYFVLSVALNLVVLSDQANAQRPFVTGVVPVVGPNGEVGGIKVDADGVARRVLTANDGKFKNAKFKIGTSTKDVTKKSSLRKISLKRLEKLLATHLAEQKALPREVELMAGLRSIEYVFVDDENKDIILAGPAGAWKSGPDGSFVASDSGWPVMQLIDLVDAFRVSKKKLQQGMTCSMDASEEGLKRYARLSRKRMSTSARGIKSAKKAIGPFQIKLDGIPSQSHFAHVLVAADIMMKRIGMNLETTSVKGVPGYMELLEQSNSNAHSMPRWWLEMDYDPIVRNESGSIWKISSGVKAQTQAEFLDEQGNKQVQQEADDVAKKWTKGFTSNYEKLCREFPVFGQLQNCMDLAVVAALIERYDLRGHSGLSLATLRDEKQISTATMPAPLTTDPELSFVQKARSTIVCVSGGVDLNCWKVAGNVKADQQLAIKEAKASQSTHWWWD